MRKAITTKFLAAGNVRGSRIKASDGDNSVTLGYDHAHHHAKRHAAVAFALATKMQKAAGDGWAGFYVCGSNKDGGYTFVSMAYDSHAGAWNHAEALSNHARRGHDAPYGIEGEDWFYLAVPGNGGTSTDFEGL